MKSKLGKKSKCRFDRANLKKIPAEARAVVAALRAAGKKAYFVGGGVRDLLAGLKAVDFDVATDARPEEVRGLFRRTAPTGIKHGTVTVLGSRGNYEVTTFRRDGKYGDARHPDDVTYARTVEEDLSRRDFTFNALAYDPVDDKLIDLFGGVDDFKRGVVRAVGAAVERFSEDGLRPLRAVRLAARFEFEIEAETLNAIPKVLERVRMVAAERVRDEFMKMQAAAPKPSYGVDLMRETGLLDLYIPELLEGYGVTQNEFHAYDVYTHSLYSCDAAPAEKPLVRLAALLHDVGKPRTRVVRDGRVTFYNHQAVSRRMARHILDRLRFSKKERDHVLHLIYYHMFGYTPSWTDAAVRRLIRKVGRENIADLFDLRIADWFGNGTNYGFPGYLRALERRINEAIAREEAFTEKDLALDGRDVMAALEIPPGPKVGEALSYLLERVLEDQSLNDRERLLGLLREKFGPGAGGE
ncbi:MAG: HD domain-containing protein [candidate division Zixibacteria bacterium]|nr:HD domain-containing protein [candidate division Zixibacteria bacterium]